MISLGMICVVLGVIGIFLPLLPTTPFILLAGWLFARSSDRFHRWLYTHPQLGPILSGWHSGKGFSKKVRKRILLMLWASMLISMAIVAKVWAVILLGCIGTSVTIYLLKQPLND